jgi:hypothetical protein
MPSISRMEGSSSTTRIFSVTGCEDGSACRSATQAPHGGCGGLG